MLLKKVFLVLLIFLFCAVSASAEPAQPGSLKVISDEEGVETYVDGALAGGEVVTIKNILAGQHYIVVKSGGEIIFRKTVLVQSGEQTLVVAHPEKTAEATKSQKAQSDKEKSTFFVVDITSGGYNLTGSFAGYNWSSSYPGATGISVGFNNILGKDLFSYYYGGGIGYNSKTIDTQLSYLYLNVGGKNEIAFTEAGINYSFWQVDGLTVSGNVGYQIAVGFGLTSRIAVGAKYEMFNGAFTYSSYPGTITFARSAIFMRIQ
ncbi:MAG: hypothetical protein WC901_06435 [Candidatus Margulisiibacteriota bacterium]